MRFYFQKFLMILKWLQKKSKKIKKQEKKYTIIACAEGAISEEDSLLSKKKYKAKLQVAKDVRLLMKSLNNYKS